MINQTNQNENTQNKFFYTFKELKIGKLLRKSNITKNCGISAFEVFQGKNLFRSGVLSTFTLEQIIRIIDLTYKDFCDFGYKARHWSLSLLVTEIKKQGIADQISEKSVSRFLK